MRISLRCSFQLFTALAAVACFMVSAQTVAAQDEFIQFGKELFKHDWSGKEDIPTFASEAIPQRPVIGPVYNAGSCAACHFKGGDSGNSRNVQLLSLVKRKETGPMDQDLLKAAVSNIHPSFGKNYPNQNSMILHRFGTDLKYNLFRKRLLGQDDQKVGMTDIQKARIERAKRRKVEKPNKQPVQLIRKVFSHDLVLTERNSPSLFGGSTIEQVSERVIRKVEQEQARIDDGISGKLVNLGVGIFGETKVGRLGWRGQVSEVEDFVLGACTNELGIQVQKGKSVSTESLGPFSINDKPNENAELDKIQTSALVAFVKSLPAPRQDTTGFNTREVRRGEQVFNAVHCNRCHVRDMGPASQIYSDLLLHDMGPGLSDPMPGPITNQKTGVTIGPVGYYGNGFFGIFEQLPTASMQEWRTPPLWGIADTAPYMHDGRATDLMEAIMMHGGEAAHSRMLFSKLRNQDKRNLIQFLLTLKTQY